MNDDRCAIGVEGDDGYVRCSNRAGALGLCDAHHAEIAKARLDSLRHGLLAAQTAAIERNTAESHGFGSQVAKVAKTQSITVTGPGKPGHQIDVVGEKVLGQGPDGEGE